MEEKQIIPHGMDLNQIPVNNSLAIVPVEDPLPLAVIPPKPLAPPNLVAMSEPTLPKFMLQLFHLHRSVSS
jgi:hypothetical protein